MINQRVSQKIDLWPSGLTKHDGHFKAKLNGCKTQENPEAGPGKGEVHVFNI